MLEAALDPDLLEQALASPDPKVRLRLARERRAPRWALERLAADPDPQVSQAARRLLEKGLWRYASTLARRFGLTRYQIQTAVQQGLLEGREAVNLHYPSGPRALLVREDVLEARLEAVRALPKEPLEAIAARQAYRERGKVRRSLRFFCPRCNEEVRPRRDSRASESALDGQLPPEEARRLILLAHYRHRHTDYERFLEQPERFGFAEDAAELKELQARFKKALRRRHGEEALAYQQALLESGRAHFNRQAEQLLRQDGLLNSGENPKV